MTSKGRAAIRDEIRLSWDGTDPWGSALSVGFAACDVLHWATGTDVPAECDYSPGIAGPDEESYPDSVFLELLDARIVKDEDLAYWARVIDRFLDLVPEDLKY